jgi:hypothetical protein
MALMMAAPAIVVVKVNSQFLHFKNYLIDFLEPGFKLFLAIEVVVPETMIAPMEADEGMIGSDDWIRKKLQISDEEDLLKVGPGEKGCGAVVD